MGQKQKEFNRDTRRMPNKGKKVWGTKKINKKKLRRKEKDEGGKKDRQSGRVRRRKHKSVALLGWMLTPVRDY